MDITTLAVLICMVVAVLCVCLFKFANKDGKVRTEYDERQKAVRGKAYTYAFYTELIAQTLIMFLLMTGVELPIEDYALIFIGMILGCEVLCAYCVWNDVYWGLNNDKRRFHIIFVAGIFINALDIVIAAVSGTLVQNGKVGMYMLNITVLIMLVLIYIEMLIKSIIDRKAAAVEE